MRNYRKKLRIPEHSPAPKKSCIYNPQEQKLSCLKLRDVLERFWEGFGGIFGRCLGKTLGHVWEVFEGMLKGF